MQRHCRATGHNSRCLAPLSALRRRLARRCGTASHRSLFPKLLLLFHDDLFESRGASDGTTVGGAVGQLVDCSFFGCECVESVHMLCKSINLIGHGPPAAHHHWQLGGGLEKGTHKAMRNDLLVGRRVRSLASYWRRACRALTTVHVSLVGLY